MSGPVSPTLKPATPRLPFKPAHLSRLSFPASARAHLDDQQPERDSTFSFDSATRVSEAYNAAAGARGPREESSISRVSSAGGEDKQQAGDELNTEGWAGVEGRNAWVLFDFEGEIDGNELSVTAQTHIQILSHDLPASASLSSAAQPSPLDVITSTTEGWSVALIPTTGLIGLIPQSYFSYHPPPTSHPTRDMLPRTIDIIRPLDDADDEEEDDGPPTRSFTSDDQASEILPQTTGGLFGGASMFASKIVREGVLPGGRNVNRFSTFVVSGAEDFILSGPPSFASLSPATPTTGLPPKGGGSHFRFGSSASTESGGTISGGGAGGGSVGEADKHFVETGPSWRVKTPPFQLSIHSPSKRKSNVGLSEYTIYYITSTFTTTLFSSASSTSINTGSESQSASPSSKDVKVTVERRFSNFLALQTYLQRKFPSLAIPPLPEKQYSGRFSDDFVEARRGDLERWMRRVTRHPVVRYSDGVVGFLGVEESEQWDEMYPAFSTDPHVGPHFYANLYHPAYNLDLEDASSIDRFATHLTALGKSVQHLRAVVGKTREGAREQALNRRSLALGMLSLITSKRGAEEDEEDDDGGTGGGLINSEGAWCWKEGCEDCLKLTKAMQGVSDKLLEVSEIEDKHACSTLLQTQEALKDVAHPSTLYAPVIETHRATLSRYAEAIAEEAPITDNTISFVGPSDEIAARCETVLNSTMAETSHYHDTKLEDFQQLTTSYLDSEIDHLTSVLSKLVAARQLFNQPTYDELSEQPRLPSRYEADLATTPLSRPLVQPSPHVFDSLTSTLRPVSMAVSTLGESAAGLLWSAVPSFVGGGGGTTKGRAVSSADGRLSRWLW